MINPRSYLTSLLALALLLLTACSQPPAPKSLPELNSDAVILAFGDSITYGTGAARQQSYPAQLAGMTSLKVINAGVPGETTVAGLKRLPGVFEKVKPDLVLLCLGGNDFLRRLNRDEARANLAAMIEWLQAQDVPVVLVTVPELGFGLTGTLKPAAMYAGLAQQYKLPLQNDILAEVLSDRGLKSDAIHPNAAGYQRIAEAIQVLLQELGSLPSGPN